MAESHRTALANGIWFASGAAIGLLSIHLP